MGNFKIPKHLLSLSRSVTGCFLRVVGLTTHLQHVPRVKYRTGTLPPPPRIITFMFSTEKNVPATAIYLLNLQPTI